jgi:hypothetical protein
MLELSIKKLSDKAVSLGRKFFVFSLSEQFITIFLSKVWRTPRALN